MSFGNEAELKLVLRAQDQASAQIERVTHMVQGLGAQADRVSGHVNALSGRMSAFGHILTGIAQGIGQQIFFQLERGFARLVGLLPDLIGKGEAWAATLDRIQDSTGMSAEAAFQLAAAAKFVGFDVSVLGTALARFARNAIDSADAFKRFGVDIAYTNTGAVDVAATLTNVRRVMSEAGASAEATAGLMNLLGRAGFEAADLLLLTDAQLKLITDDARASGLAMSQAAIDMAENLQRTRNQLDSTITGLGAQILTGVGPALIGLINGIAKAIQDNMDAIVRFAVQVVNFIAGLISGLFGFNIATISLAESVGHVAGNTQALANTLSDTGERAKKAASGEDALTRSLNRQIEAIDRQLRAMGRREQAHDAARERQELVGDIEEMRAQLEDLKTKGVFTAGMSEAEAELARQAAAADIMDGQEQLSEAQGRLAEHDRDEAARRRREELEDERRHLQDRLAEHRKFLQKLAQQQQTALAHLARLVRPTISRPAGQGFTPGFLEERGGIIGAVTAAAASARQAGIDFANKIKDFLNGAGALVGFIGGLVGKLNILIPLMIAARALPLGGGTGAGLGIGSAVTIAAFSAIAIDQFMLGQAAMFRGLQLTPAENKTLSETGLAAALGLANDPLAQTLAGILGPGFQQTLQALGVIGDTAEGTNRNLSPGSSLFRTFTDLLGITQPIADNTEQAVLTAEEAAVLAADTVANTLAMAAKLAAGVGVTNPAFDPIATSTQGAYDKLNGGIGVTNPSLGSIATNTLNAYGKLVAGIPVTNAPGTTLDIYGKIINAPGTTLNADGKMIVTNPSVPVSVENQPKVSVENQPKVSVTNPSIPVTNPDFGNIASNTLNAFGKLTAGIDAKVTNEPKVSVGNEPKVTVGNPSLPVTNPALDAIQQNTLDAFGKLTAGISTTISGTPTVNAATGFSVKVPGGVDIANVPNVKVPGEILIGGVAVERLADIKRYEGLITGNTNPISYLKFVGGKLAVSSTGTAKPPPGGGGGCFVYGTLVETPGGRRCIETIEIGDVVIAVDTETMRRVPQAVSVVHRHPGNQEPRVSFVLIDGREFQATISHPLYDAAASEFRPAGEFSAGMAMRDVKAHQDIVIESVTDAGDLPLDVCDITVETHHNYLINDGLLVHNSTGKGIGLAGGALFNTLGAMSMTVGEAGPETVAVLRNPRQSSGGFGGDNRPILIQVLLDSRVVGETVTNWQQLNTGRSTTLRPGGR